MSLRLFFHPRAEEELNEAAAYYEGESHGLGLAFVEAIEGAINQILAFPDAAPLVNAFVRRKIVRSFPYSVMYSSDESSVRILAIANQKRRPSYWRGRR